MRRIAATVVVASFALVAACGGSGGGGSNGGNGVVPPSCEDDVGVALLSWTIHNQAPTADQGCVGVDHLIAEMRSPCNDIQIAPVPCISGNRWRYDALPAGDQIINLYAVTKQGFVTAAGSVEATLTNTVPAKPLAIDLE